MPRARSHPPTLKRYGQHFLNDRTALADIADAARLTNDDVVVEIGPGRGALTDQLLSRAGRVVAIEIDKQLTQLLREKYAADTRVTIIEGDVLDIRISDVAGGPFTVVGNVPYYITTPILFHALRPPLPVRCVFLVQREVAERIVSPPGSREYGALSVNVQAVAKAEIVRIVPAGAFSPPPKVESAVVRITPLQKPIVAENEIESFRTFVLSVFGMRRKQIATILRSVWSLAGAEATRILAEVGIDPKARPETLSPEQLAGLLRRRATNSQ
jgi:16S rRNA (adenine1518-N6/adenine1519-N6)-dimethyltransferase